MKKIICREYTAPQIELIILSAEQTFATSAVFTADHEGFGYYGDENE